MNIREYLDCKSSYSAINREERNLAAILYHALLLEGNLSRFLALVECPYMVDKSEMAIFLEYAYPRDLWSQIGDNETKRGLILTLLNPPNVDELGYLSLTWGREEDLPIPRFGVRQTDNSAEVSDGGPPGDRHVVRVSGPEDASEY